MTAISNSRPASFQATDLAHIGVFAALIAALAIVPPIQVVGPVPITLQTLGVALAGLCLGPWRGFAATLLYVVLGVAGLPIFSGGKSGLATLFGPSGGYLVAFPLAALLTGFVAVWTVRRGLSTLAPLIFFIGLLAARYLIILPLGVLGVMRATEVNFMTAFTGDMLFWLGDSLKSLVAVILAHTVHRAFPRLLVQR
ncbi:biotin transporter BioY [Arachnia propionica]|uniref:Biotin transporter n=1 Tax=Arachnia propionica TaxID=1750 RepID=A0A3P1T8C2_9ACTN|nr:biotin transporter BioY [Arachnia propionica]MDO5084122.1 biotin transporter BioY [Arachnia propionica]RRD05694.1 biotin transporter BioY [Arachnia propionica]